MKIVNVALSAKPGMGVDEAMIIVKNEMSRVYL